MSIYYRLMDEYAYSHFSTQTKYVNDYNRVSKKKQLRFQSIKIQCVSVIRIYWNLNCVEKVRNLLGIQ